MIAKIRRFLGMTGRLAATEKGPSMMSSNAVGLRKGAVGLVVVDRKRWRGLFEAERVRIEATINQPMPDEKAGLFKFEPIEGMRILHTGSTSLDGITAKPILDVLVGFRTRSDLHKAVRRVLENDPAELMLVMRPRQVGFFLIARTQRDGYVTAHLHFAAMGGRYWRTHRNIMFMLRRSRRLRSEYGARKALLGAKHPESRRDYSREKSVFIDAIIRRKRLGDERRRIAKYRLS
jgi:GrpB-like predicted nucleotidyltransferase (UPF0157 family)